VSRRHGKAEQARKERTETEARITPSTIGMSVRMSGADGTAPRNAHDIMTEKKGSSACSSGRDSEKEVGGVARRPAP
jgi:hypothetical protein